MKKVFLTAVSFCFFGGLFSMEVVTTNGVGDSLINMNNLGKRKEKIYLFR